MPDLEDITILQKKHLVNFQSIFFWPQPLEWFSEHVFFTLSPLKVELYNSIFKTQGLFVDFTTYPSIRRDRRDDDRNYRNP